MCKIIFTILIIKNNVNFFIILFPKNKFFFLKPSSLARKYSFNVCLHMFYNIFSHNKNMQEDTSEVIVKPYIRTYFIIIRLTKFCKFWHIQACNRSYTIIFIVYYCLWIYKLRFTVDNIYSNNLTSVYNNKIYYLYNIVI